MIHPHGMKVCQHCDVAAWDGWMPKRIFLRNGSVRFVMTCPECGEVNGDAVPKRRVDTGNLPILRDERPWCCGGRGCANCGTQECVVCGSYERVEEHHWTPRHLWWKFNDPQAWPTSHLCRPCHEEWHRNVTPNMTNRDGNR